MPGCLGQSLGYPDAVAQLGHLLLPSQDRRNGELLLHHRQHGSALYPANAPGRPGGDDKCQRLTGHQGWQAEVNYLPWLNVKLQAQYTLYNKFNGAGTNYDGAGRSASDNNALYLLLWFAF